MAIEEQTTITIMQVIEYVAFNYYLIRWHY